MVSPPCMPRGRLIICIYHNEDSHHHEVDDKPHYWTIEAYDVAAGYTFAEKNTVVVVVWNTNIAILTVLHIVSNIHVTFCAVIMSWSLRSILVCNVNSFRPVIFLWLFLGLLPLSLLNAVSFGLKRAHLNVIFCFFLFIGLLAVPFLCVIQIYLFLNTRISEDASEQQRQVDNDESCPYIQTIGVGVLDHVDHEY